MNEQEFLSLTGLRQRIYYKTVKIAVEYFDSMGNTVRLDGQLPEGKVKDVTASAECDKSFMSGRLHGELRTISTATGKPLLIENYRNGLLDGLRQEYFEDGLPKTEQFFKNGKLDGPSREYYDSGGIRIEDSYKDGLLLVRKEFRENDHAKAAAPRFHSDQPPAPSDSAKGHDAPLNFNAIMSDLEAQSESAGLDQEPAPAKNAEITRKSFEDFRNYYIADREIAKEKLDKTGQPLQLTGTVPNGIVKEFYKNGQLKFEEEWRNSKPNGYKKKFDELGRIWAEENYQDGKLEGLVKIHNYFKDKVFEEEAQFSDGLLHGARKTFYPNGVLSVEENYANGKLAGQRKAYYESGGVNTDENYHEDRLHGPRKRFYENGKIWIEESYAEGKLEGRRRDFYVNGKLRLQENYKSGQLDGKRTFYYDNGLPMYEEDYMFGRMTSRQEYKENRFRPNQ